MKILVCGGAGFIGSHLVDYLIEKRHNVAVIDDFSGSHPRNVNPNAKLFHFDLTHKGNEFVFNEFKPAILFYLVANAREGASFFQPADVTSRNVCAYVNTLESAIKHGIKKIILFSSMARFGEQTPPFTEDLQPRPQDIYAINKVAMEEITKQLSEVFGFEWTILVPRNVFGERQGLTRYGMDKYRNVVTIFCNRILRHEPIYIYGDGNQKRSFSYIKDSLPCYIKCMEPETNKEIINIGGMHPITINELADLICDTMGVDAETYPRIHLSSRYGEVKYAYASYDKSVKLLEYREEYGYKEGIKRTVKWMKDMGPQSWVDEKLSLQSDKMPEIWE